LVVWSSGRLVVRSSRRLACTPIFGAPNCPICPRSGRMERSPDGQGAQLRLGIPVGDSGSGIWDLGTTPCGREQPFVRDISRASSPEGQWEAVPYEARGVSMMRGSRPFRPVCTARRPGAPVPRHQRMGNGGWRMHMSPTASGQAWSGENLECKTAKSARPPDAQRLR
jgi:hypothetical protein